jgi:hypothetical protein
MSSDLTIGSIASCAVIFGRRPKSTRGESDQAVAEELDLDMYDDVVLTRDGQKIYGSVGEIRGSLVKIVRTDGAEPMWVNWREVKVL